VAPPQVDDGGDVLARHLPEIHGLHPRDLAPQALLGRFPPRRLVDQAEVRRRRLVLPDRVLPIGRTEPKRDFVDARVRARVHAPGHAQHVEVQRPVDGRQVLEQSGLEVRMRRRAATPGRHFGKVQRTGARMGRPPEHRRRHTARDRRRIQRRPVRRRARQRGLGASDARRRFGHR